MPTASAVETPIHTLLIESEAQKNEAVRDILGIGGGGDIALDCVTGYDAGLEILLRGGHQVVLVDAKLGKQSGVDLVRAAQNTRADTPASFIVLSESRDKTTTRAALEAGAADVLAGDELASPLLERAIRYAKRHKEFEAQLAEFLLFDPTTGLATQNLFWHLLTNAVARAERNKANLSLLCIYVGGIAEINDTHGMAAGDKALAEVARRLQQTVRASDSVARASGTKFTLLLDGLTEEADVQIALERITDAVGAPLKIAEKNMPLALTVGISLFPRSADSAAALMRNAVTAMDYAHDLGIGGYYFG